MVVRPEFQPARKTFVVILLTRWVEGVRIEGCARRGSVMEWPGVGKVEYGGVHGA